jgi:transcriptional regulator with XRE-family HTH domain
MRPKNRRVLETREERIRIGMSLQRRRLSLGLNQEDVAAKAPMAVGTVQNIEYNKRKVGIDKFNAYAKVVGTTVEQLLHPEIVEPLDPKWQDLNEDHLEIARRYMKARTRVREAVEMLLAEETGPPRETTIKLAELVLTIKEAADHDHAVIRALVVLLEDTSLLVEIAGRVDADPDALRELLNTKPK